MSFLTQIFVSAFFIAATYSASLPVEVTENVEITTPITTTEQILPIDETPEANSEDLTRHKKHTTTFCVEIRPSGPYQKPFQVCEPASKTDYVPAQEPSSYYASEQPSAKTEAPAYPEKKDYAAEKPAYAPSSQSAAAYAAPSKSYQQPSTTAPTYAAPKEQNSASAYHHSPYNSLTYREAEEMQSLDAMTLNNEELQEMARAATDSTEEDMMRSAYGVEYGQPSVTYISPLSKLKKKILAKKLGGHNGLVISCQPALAGYASSVPAYGGGYGSGPAYRSSTPGTYQTPYSRPKHLGYAIKKQYQVEFPQHHSQVEYPQQGTYGQPQPQKPVVAPAFAPNAYYSAPASYNPPPSAAPSYEVPPPPPKKEISNSYGTLPPPPAISYSPPATQYRPQQPTYSRPAFIQTQPEMQPAYEQVIEENQPQAKPQSYFEMEGYGSVPKAVYKQPSFVPVVPYSQPQTYRASDHMTDEEKVRHTVQKMTDISNERASDNTDTIKPADEGKTLDKVIPKDKENVGSRWQHNGLEDDMKVGSKWSHMGVEEKQMLGSRWSQSRLMPENTDGMDTHMALNSEKGWSPGMRTAEIVDQTTDRTVNSNLIESDSTVQI